MFAPVEIEPILFIGNDPVPNAWGNELLKSHGVEKEIWMELVPMNYKIKHIIRISYCYLTRILITTKETY